MLEQKLKTVECHFTWDLKKEDADLNYLEIKFTEDLSVLIKKDKNSWNRKQNFLAYIKHLQGLNDQAIQCLERENEADNDFTYCAVTYGNLAWLYHLMANDSMAEVYMEKLSKILDDSSDPSEKMLREVQSEKAWSLLWFSKKYSNRAKEIFFKALEKEPDDKEWNTGYAFAMFHLEGLQIREDLRLPFEGSPAVTQLMKALELDPENAMIHVYLGLKSYKNERNDDAWVHMRKALTMAPYDLRVVLYGAKFMKKEKCYDMALSVLQKMLTKAPESSRLHHEIANNYRWKALQIRDPHNPELLNLCIHHIEEGARLNPDFLYPQIELALRYSEVKKYAKAEQKFQELYNSPKLQPADLQAWYRHYGDFNLYRLGSEATAVKHYKNGLALQKVSTEWVICRTRLYKVLDKNRKDVYEIREFIKKHT